MKVSASKMKLGCVIPVSAQSMSELNTLSKMNADVSELIPMPREVKKPLYEIVDKSKYGVSQKPVLPENIVQQVEMDKAMSSGEKVEAKTDSTIYNAVASSEKAKLSSTSSTTTNTKKDNGGWVLLGVSAAQ